MSEMATGHAANCRRCTDGFVLCACDNPNCSGDDTCPCDTGKRVQWFPCLAYDEQNKDSVVDSQSLLPGTGWKGTGLVPPIAITISQAEQTEHAVMREAYYALAIQRGHIRR